MSPGNPFILGSKVKVTSGWNIAGVGYCTVVSAGFFWLLLWWYTGTSLSDQCCAFLRHQDQHHHHHHHTYIYNAFILFFHWRAPWWSVAMLTMRRQNLQSLAEWIPMITDCTSELISFSQVEHRRPQGLLQWLGARRDASMHLLLSKNIGAVQISYIAAKLKLDKTVTW